MMSKLQRYAATPGGAYLLVLLAALALYGITCAPGLIWQDGGMFQWRILERDFAGDLGLALAHPLYILLGLMAEAIPLGSVFHRINLISAVAAAFAVANVFLLLRLWLERAFPAVMAALVLALSHTFWQHACIAEVYTLYAATFTAELIFLYRYVKQRRTQDLALLGLFNGLSIANHMWAIIPLAVYGVLLLALLLRRELKGRQVAWAGLCWGIGALPYTILIVDHMLAGATVGETIQSALFGSSYQGAVTNLTISGRIVVENILLIGMNFPTPVAFLAIAGLAGLYRCAPRRALAHAILAITLLFLAFAFRYQVPDRYAFFLPFYVMLAVLIGLGVHVVISPRQRRGPSAAHLLVVLGALLPIAVYAALPSVAERLDINLGLKRTIPFRDEYRFFLQPWQTGYRGAERFAEAAFAAASPGAYIYADSTTNDPLRLYQRYYGVRPDVTVVSGRADLPFAEDAPWREIVTGTSFYVVSPSPGYCPAELLTDEFTLVPQGVVLYRVTINRP